MTEGPADPQYAQAEYRLQLDRFIEEKGKWAGTLGHIPAHCPLEEQ